MNKMLRLILINSRPIALIVFCGVVGYFLGSFWAGCLVGVAVLALLHLFL